ncbi:zinc finger protein CONSTANS-LIKE 16-like [Amaranthus tricolor]|uniref:zinc finger protein CONSTANS-LIKE 16-like n=1 Tax=Amaranthus tricolor TaxID=29722 RepID=UPI002590A13B|nr:zinc finger protein CONSTANS-LIKE 16-like [Amaranthus tricolor]
MITQKTANSVGGKTARPCESCLKKRASWFCPADNAFLCNACDSLVHSANELAGRHKRVRLETASSKPNPNTAVPSWHQGFSKKARTPRNNKAKSSYVSQIMPVVPEINNNDDDNEGFVEEEENEESDVFFNVPNFDHDDHNHDDGFNDVSLIGFDGDEWNNMHGFIPLGNEFEGLLEFKPEPELEPEIEVVKTEEEDDVGTSDHCIFDWSIDMESEMLNFDLNYGCSNGEEEEEYKVVVGPKEEENYEMNINMNMNKRRKILLRLNYEEVINAWANMGCSSPWINGQRPDFDLDSGAWPGPNCMRAASPIGFYQEGKEWIGFRGDVKGGNEEREARVSRYREKRRTRLFSKKIRYQVRKLNAEKRPRLKGRFVKRTI